MNRRTTWLIVALMSIALVGLTSFQIYWINNALELNKKRFKENVFESLNYVVKNLEDREVVHLADNEFFFINTDSSKVHRIRTREPRQPIIISQGSSYSYSSQDDNGVVTIKNYQFNEQPDSSVQVLRKKEAINIVIERLISDKKSIEQRVNHKVIDSLLRKSLRQQGIDIKFQFAIWNAHEDSVVLTNTANNIEAIKNSELKASLFPNDIMDNMNYLAVNFPTQDSFLFKEVWLTLLTSIIFILTIIGCFGYAIHIIFKQKRLSEIKNDFINNMTHELKTPLATVSLACQALNEPEIQDNKLQFSRYLEVIKEENKRLSNQVEKVLQSALLDRKSFELHREPVAISKLLKESIRKQQLTVEDRKGLITSELETEDIVLQLDREHMMNVFHNLIDNAIKYSRKAPEVNVQATANTKEVTIKISDRGIGMKASEINQIFDRFYRVSTGDRHDVKGFGLGLSYVKSIVEKHNGSIMVESEDGKGSTFTIKLPRL